jgi:superfamily II DNA or RNA helicase
MDLKFIITLTEHRLLGFVFAPYLIKKEKGQDYHVIYDRVTLTTLSTYEPVLTPEEVQLVKYIEDYNDPNLFKLFAKKKKNSRDFMKSLPPELLKDHIRPYVERRMGKCLDILASNPIPVYHKVLQNNIYEEDRIDVVEDEVLAVFNFIRSGEGIRYFLTIEHRGKELNLTGKEGLIPINEPCCLIMNRKMFIFRDIDGKKILPFFEREYISIPPAAEKKYFETFIRNAIKKYKVNATGFTISEVKSKPVPTLTIEGDITGKYYMVLKFIYEDNTIYYANRKTELKVSCDYSKEQVSFRRLNRDYEFENECISSLLELGLVNKEGPHFLPLQKGGAKDGAAYNLINWVNFNNRFISNSGFKVAEQKLDKLYYLDDFQLKIEVSKKNNDWFDIEAKVEFAGFTMPFSTFQAYIVNGDREFLLPDGRVMILPEEWFESYRDLMNFAKIDKTSIRLEKQHFPLLSKSLQGLSGQFKEGMLDLINTGSAPEIVPGGINATLRNYQVEGYSWLYRLYKNGFGGCLADDMGLGKTLQTLTLLARVIKEAPVNGGKPPADQNNKALIVVPTSLVHNWLNEALRFVPMLRINTYVGSNRRNLTEVLSESDILITSYGILRNEIDSFITNEFLYLVMDESQMIKNPGSKTYQAAIQLQSENRIVLTGTPIENSLSDLWAQISFLNPGLLGSMNFFRSEFLLPIEKNGDENKQQKLLRLISPFLLRRSKTEVAPELPPVTEQIIYCDLDERQEAYYEREKSKARNLILERMAKNGFNKSAVVILQSLTRLRQIANHPALVDETYISDSGKYNEITRNLQNLIQEGHKALVFSSFVKHLNLVSNHLDKNGIKYAMLTGETNDREKEIKKFQEKPGYSLFLISLKAGGVGLNLTAADYVFILDPWWNPAAEMQAISRAHRIGQDKHIFVYRFISRGTLEEKILKLQERKSQLADAFIHNSLKGITEDQVLELFE